MHNTYDLNELMDSILNTDEFKELKETVGFQDEEMELRIKDLVINGIKNGLKEKLPIEKKMVKLIDYKENGKDMVKLVEYKENSIVKQMDDVELKLVYSECEKLIRNKFHDLNQYVIDVLCNINNKSKYYDLDSDMLENLFENVKNEMTERFSNK